MHGIFGSGVHVSEPVAGVHPAQAGAVDCASVIDFWKGQSFGEQLAIINQAVPDTPRTMFEILNASRQIAVSNFIFHFMRF